MTLMLLLFLCYNIENQNKQQQKKQNMRGYLRNQSITFLFLDIYIYICI